MPAISFIRQSDYDLSSLRAAMQNLLLPLGGPEKFIKRGDRVVLKLNLVCPTRGMTHAYTQAEIFQVVAEMAIDCGATVSAGDSPGASSARNVAKIAGILPIAEKLGVPIIEFSGQENFSDARVFKKLTLAKELLEADAVINLPRLKTHGQMRLTAAVKNLFGAVIGTEKFVWHSRAGSDYFRFAQMIYEVYRAVSPTLTIVDAIVAMDGEGPTSGDPNPLGFLAAGTDAPTIDAALMKILGRPPEDLYTLQAAAAAGDTAWQSPEIFGVRELGELAPKKWRWSRSQALAMIPPRWWKFIPGMNEERYRRLTALYPREIAGKCVKCGKCVEICPAKALSFTENRAALRVDQSRCIRCYCCHELCPQHALELAGGQFAKILGWLNRCWQKIS